LLSSNTDLSVSKKVKLTTLNLLGFLKPNRFELKNIF